MPIPDTCRLAASADAVVREVNGEAVLLNLTTSQYHVLDANATEMWQVLLAAPSFAEALETINARFEVSPQQLRDDLSLFVEQLAERGLVVLENA